MKSLGIFAAASAVTYYCTQYHPFEIKGSAFQFLLHQIGRNDAEKQLSIFKFMLKYKLLSNNTVDLSKLIIKQGFDNSGKLLEGLSVIKVGGVELGPISLKPSEGSNKKEGHFGILYCKSMMRTFLDEEALQILQEFKSQDKHIMKIGVNIEADDEILEYAPYLYDQNITNCVKELVRSWPLYKIDSNAHHHVDFITINTCRLKYALSEAGLDKQYDLLMNKTSQKVCTAIKQEVLNCEGNGFNKSVQLYVQETNNGRKNIPIATQSKRLFAQSQLVSWQDLLELIKK